MNAWNSRPEGKEKAGHPHGFSLKQEQSLQDSEECDKMEWFNFSSGHCLPLPFKGTGQSSEFICYILILFSFPPACFVLPPRLVKNKGEARYFGPHPGKSCVYGGGGEGWESNHVIWLICKVTRSRFSSVAWDPIHTKQRIAHRSKWDRIHSPYNVLVIS